jgi:hypothetical protein
MKKVVKFTRISQTIRLEDELLKSNRTKKVITIPLNLYLACVWFLFDLHALGDITLEELSQEIADNFCTETQECLDPDEILDLIEFPDPKVLDDMEGFFEHLQDLFNMVNGVTDPDDPIKMN